MFPEQAVVAAQETRSRVVHPAHTGKFIFAWHAWDEPTRRFSKNADEVVKNIYCPSLAKNIVSIVHKFALSENRYALHLLIIYILLQ